MSESHGLRIRRFQFLKSKRSIIMITAIALAIASLVALVSAYQWSLSPKDSQSTEKIRVIVEPGETVVDIARQLKQAGLIKNETSFRIYSILTSTKDRLQAGAYALGKNLSVADIIDHMSTGRTDEFNVFIAPGLTLKQQYDKDIEGSLAGQGFSDEELTAAFNKTYTSDLLAKRPPDSSLEGYVYPDTYRTTADSDLSVVIQKSLDEFSRVIAENSIEEKLAARGLTLHQGLTLASIVQKEASDPQDQKQVAQVFYGRLAIDMPLGSDVTFIYAANLLGVKPTISLDSPYNTRIVKGLPPGPIANFNLSALSAVADPAAGDYLYFVAGTDGVTHYARTLEEHESNVSKYNSSARTEFTY
ncbi:endolytic transglycosylase MltG [Pedobacter sp.]|nr:endolytic transglycosylase MltG [Candidatus Saccharibacteria bacterium]